MTASTLEPSAARAPRPRFPAVDRVGSPWGDVDPADFDRWSWQFKHRIDSLEAASRYFELTADEQEALRVTAGRFRFAVTPYYALLADPADPDCPVRRQILPITDEAYVRLGERRDPLGEEEREAAPNLIHRYPDRALLLVTDRCPVYCRFCTRRRIVGRVERQGTKELLAAAFSYIREHSELREVILSGGDALMLGDGMLDFVLGELRRVPHLDILRVATRMPVTCPMRVTPELTEVLRRHAPVYVMTHFNHPRELSDRAAEAVGRLVDAGVPVYNQSVLLRGVNDDVDTIRQLNRDLVYLRAVPYYLHQCDVAEGIEHFRTPLATGLDIIDALRGHTSGLAVPQLCVDVPGGLGKVTVQPDWVVERTPERIVFRTYTGERGEYPEPPRRQR